MMQIMTPTRFVAVLTLLLLTNTVHAASFNISPLRVTLTPSAKTASLTITNENDELLSVQTELVAWTQKDGKDVFTPTNDLIISPPIFKIAAGGLQTLRVGLLRPVGQEPPREMTYRLFLKEVPPPVKPGQQGVSVVMRLSVPVFVTVPGSTKPQLTWHAEKSPNGDLALSLSNSGNAHVQVNSCDLHDIDGQLLAEQQLSSYVLPGQKHSWPIKLNRSWQGSQIKLNVRTDSGDISVVLPIN